MTEHEADIASDLSAFHRIDDPMTLDGPRYFSLAYRLGAYAGVVQARALKAKQDAEEQPHYAAPAAAPSAAPATREKVSRVSEDAALAMLAVDGWVEHEKEGTAA